MKAKFKYNFEHKIFGMTCKGIHKGFRVGSLSWNTVYKVKSGEVAKTHCNCGVGE
jgi:hypothetical protein